MQFGAGHFRLAHDAALFVYGQIRLVAEGSFAILLREARVRIARIDLALLERRRLHGRRDGRRVDQRAVLQDLEQFTDFRNRVDSQA